MKLTQTPAEGSNNEFDLRDARRPWCRKTPGPVSGVYMCLPMCACMFVCICMYQCVCMYVEVSEGENECLCAQMIMLQILLSGLPSARHVQESSK